MVNEGNQFKNVIVKNKYLQKYLISFHYFYTFTYMLHIYKVMFENPQLVC